VLVFLPDRASTVAFAQILALRIKLPALESAREELRDQEETHARETLLEVLSSSVAFHNSDLAPEERALVERHFRSGGIRVLFSTSTLAMGLNLPVKNVILDGKRWQYLRRYSRWSLEDISKSEYENMSGRAGRLAFTNDFGRSILVTYSPFEADVWLRHYAESDFEDIAPTLGDAPLENHVVNLLASGLAKSKDELRHLLLSSFTGFVHWAQAMSREEFAVALDKALEICIHGALVSEDPNGALAATHLGIACAKQGLGADTTVALAQWADQARGHVLTEVEVLTAVSLTPAGNGIYVNMSQKERQRADYRAQLLDRAQADGIADHSVFEQFTNSRWAIEYETAKAFKKALLLCDWMEEVQTKEIERRYQVWAGSIRRMGEEYAWLIEGLSAVADACDWPEPRCRELGRIADRLVHGVRADAVSLAKLRSRGLGRVLLRRLVAAGFDDADALRAAGPEVVRKAVNHRGAFTSLWAKVTGEEDERAAPPLYPSVIHESPLLLAAEAATVGTFATAGVTPIVAPILVVNLLEHRVTYRGHEIPTRPPHNLQRQPLLALAVLAARAGEAMTMADLADGMFRLGGLAKRPIAPDAKDLRYKLLRPFKRALKASKNAAEVDRLVESVAGVGLRLNLHRSATVIEAPR
jgi:helicase